MELAAHLDDCPADGAHRIAEIEDKHFWFSARAALIQRHLEARFGDLQGQSVLDIGCGTGYVLGVLEKAGVKPTGCDMHQSALDYARARTTGPLLLIDANELQNADFDAAMLCDVIEHADNDVDLVQVAAATVRDGGIVLVTVPAHQWLWTAIDDYSGHKRRYSRGQLGRVLRDAGLQDVRVSYFNRVLLPAQVARNLMARGGGSDEAVREAAVAMPSPLINNLMSKAMTADRYLPPMVLGASLIATGVVRRTGTRPNQG